MYVAFMRCVPLKSMQVEVMILMLTMQSQILLGELASKFSLLQHQIDDPFLVGFTNDLIHTHTVAITME